MAMTLLEKTDQEMGVEFSVTRLSQRLLPNVVLKFYQIGFFFYQTRANSAF
jgi:hypothetical protein